MSPDVVEKKLTHMTGYLTDLQRHRDVTFDQFMEQHYEVERIIELLVITASDIILHLISARGEQIPASYRSAFLRAGELGIISESLSRNLALSAGLRNVLVHEYEEIDYKLVHQAVPAAIRDFAGFVAELSKS